jgi:hypothetical protein
MKFTFQKKLFGEGLFLNLLMLNDLGLKAAEVFYYLREQRLQIFFDAVDSRMDLFNMVGGALVVTLQRLRVLGRDFLRST